MAALDPQNLKLGPCYVFYGGENLGYTMDNSLAIKSELNTFEIIPDQEGSAVREYVTGQKYMVEATLGETARTALLALITGAEDKGDGSIAFCASTGFDLLSIADELILVPLDPNDTDQYRFPKASPKVSMELLFQKEAVRQLPVSFVCFPDKAEHTHSAIGTGAMMVIEDRPAT